MQAGSLDKNAHGLGFDWLIKLRWSAIAGQILTIAGVRLVLGFDPPLGALGLIVLVEVLTNVAAQWYARGRTTIPEMAVVGLMLTDLVALTGMLYFTGGPFNPFNFLYLVHITLSSVVLRARWTWVLAALSATMYGLLFFYNQPMGFVEGVHHDHMWMHLEGMWVAFVVAAVFIAWFVHKVTATLARRELELTRAREEAERHKRLASLATLAAGAAHELATPLGTIAVLARELERELERADDELSVDARLIRQQVDRCRGVLQQMSTDAGQSAGEPMAEWPIGTLVEKAVGGLPKNSPVDVQLDPATAKQIVRIFPNALEQALRGVLKNALEASKPEQSVKIWASDTHDRLLITVEDGGAGMPPDILERVGEPFFTTKSPGRGMGLGLFLTRSVLEKMGGELDIESTAGTGTRVTLKMPKMAEGGA